MFLLNKYMDNSVILKPEIVLIFYISVEHCFSSIFNYLTFRFCNKNNNHLQFFFFNLEIIQFLESILSVKAIIKYLVVFIHNISFRNCFYIPSNEFIAIFRRSIISFFKTLIFLIQHIISIFCNCKSYNKTVF